MIEQSEERENSSNDSNEPIPRRMYKHYKGGLYTIIGIGLLEESLEEMVVYANLSDGKIWIRPKESFFAKHPIHGKRFTLIP